MTVRASSYEPCNQAGLVDIGGTNFSSVHMGNLSSATEVKNAQKAPKIPVEQSYDLSATLQARRS